MREYGSEFSLISTDNNKYFTDLFDNTKGHIELLRSGRDALGVASDCLPKMYDLILMPAYCCSSMIKPFSIRKKKIKFYRLNEDLTIDINFLLSIIS